MVRYHKLKRATINIGDIVCHQQVNAIKVTNSTRRLSASISSGVYIVIGRIFQLQGLAFAPSDSPTRVTRNALEICKNMAM